MGSEPASSRLVQGLLRLEYRGYDSAGICVIDKHGDSKLIKSTGRVTDLKNIVDNLRLDAYTTGIGHTRWATHGKVTDKNCHPHVSSDGRFYAVHNGIIENYAELREMLIREGHTFYGETDTEVAVNLFAHLFTGDITETLKRFMQIVQGAYALVFIDQKNPNLLFGAKLGSPLVIGMRSNEWYVASDHRCLAGFVDEYITLQDGDRFIIQGEKYTILSGDTEATRDHERMGEDERASELGTYKYFMLKEIHEQPGAIRNACAGRIDFTRHDITNQTIKEVIERGFTRVHIIASGTSSWAGMVGKYYFEELAGMETDVSISAEFRYKRQFINEKTLYIFLSQSGETADTLESLKIVNAKGGYSFGIVNVPGSSIARLSQAGLFTHAGMEVGVASTKAFVGQMTVLLIVALAFGRNRDLSSVRYETIITELERLPDRLDRILAETSDTIQTVAKKYAHYEHLFFLGRWPELAIAAEGSLKLKELSYQHSEAYASGELKHGPIALIDANFPSVMINGGWPLSAKNTSSVEQIKSRNGKVVGIIQKNDPAKSLYDDTIAFESGIYELAPFSEILILHLFACYTADFLGRDVDKPRNLAKSVTVE